MNAPTPRQHLESLLKLYATTDHESRANLSIMDAALAAEARQQDAPPHSCMAVEAEVEALRKVLDAASRVDAEAGDDEYLIESERDLRAALARLKESR